MQSPKNLTTEPDPSSASAFDPLIIWVTFRRCWVIALPIGAIFAGITALVVLRSFVPIYTASHLLEANQDFVVFQHVMPVVKNLARTEKSLFYNPIILDPVLADPEFRKAPNLSNPATAESNLKKNLRIVSGGIESRMLVSYSDSSPEAAAMICNAVVESYLRQRDAFDNNRVSNLERWLDPEIQRWEQAVEERQRVVQKLSEQMLGFAPGKQAALMENQSNFNLATSLRVQITELNLNISVEEARLTMNAADRKNNKKTTNRTVESNPFLGLKPPSPTEIEIEKLVSADREIIEVRDRLKFYERALMAIEDQGRVGIRRSEYKRLKERVSFYEASLIDAKESARVEAIKRLTQVFIQRNQGQIANRKEQARIKVLANEQNRLEKLALAQDQINETKTRLAVIQKQYQIEKERLEKFGGSTAELQFAQEELGVATDVLHKLRDRVAAIRTERRQDGAVRTLAPAQPPRAPKESVPYKKLATYCGGAMMIPFALGLLWELRVQRLTDSAMCLKHGLPVVAEIARLPSASQRAKDQRLFQESVDALRASLLLSPHSAKARSIALVSGMSGEGKSSVSAQLAISLAKATGETVLLVDADFRCPEQSKIFGLKNGPGLAEVLAESSNVFDAIDKSPGSLIHVLPAGSVGANRHCLVNRENIETLIASVLKQYSFVVFDTAPILAAGETLALASAVDTTLICVMRDTSRVSNVVRAAQRLGSVGASIAGIVFNGISVRQYVDRYGDYDSAIAPQENRAA